MADRALATIETITEIAPIPDADAIVRARVRGWDVVVKKGEFAVGDPVVYMEVDTHLDTADPRFEFLAPRGVRTADDGFTGHVLKTAKLRGQYSQGIAFPLAAFPELAGRDLGDDVTELLRVQKWDPPLPAELAGQVRGHFPAKFQKTDEERIQNLAAILATDGRDWLATEKVDGTSVTVHVDGEDYGVASRNLDLVYNPDNSLWKAAIDHNLHALLRGEYDGRPAAVQGELFGPGIQGNPLQVKQVQFRVFTVQVGGREIPRSDWPDWALELSVPVHDLPFPTTLDEALAQADSVRSAINPQRPVEGIVWRRRSASTIEVDGRVVRASVKVISNRYLLKTDR